MRFRFWIWGRAVGEQTEEKKVEIEGAGEISTENKEIALLIAVLALMLAIAELLGGSAQTRSVQSNIEAANLWSFYQAKAIRSAQLESAIELAEADMPVIAEQHQREAREALITKWKGKIEHYENDPKTKEGREQLKERAGEAERERDLFEKKHARYEIAIGAFHIAIVLASASIITGLPILIYGSGLLGLFGLINLLSSWLLAAS